VRRWIKLPFVAILISNCLVAIPSAQAATFSCGTGTYTVTAGVASAGGTCTGRLTLDRSVTSIADNAFKSASGLTSVFIPNTVTSMGVSAFQQTSLASVDFESNSTLTTVGDGAFQQTPITSFVFPDSVTEIGAYQFWVNPSLTSVVFPKNLSVLRVNAIGNSSSISTFTIGIGTQSILPGAFSLGAGFTSYAYCGLTLTTAALNSGGLTGKTRTCVLPQIALTATSEVVAPNSALTGYSITSPNGFGGGVASYSISPPITTTPGLSFDTSTGLVSGTPTTIASPVTYTISANNYAGGATASFTITVKATPTVDTAAEAGKSATAAAAAAAQRDKDSANVLGILALAIGSIEQGLATITRSVVKPSTKKAAPSTAKKTPKVKVSPKPQTTPNP
jgi:hypothetical protein